jgi:hypothetical protein
VLPWPPLSSSFTEALTTITVWELSDCVIEKFLNMCTKHISRNIPYMTLPLSNTEKTENTTLAGSQEILKYQPEGKRSLGRPLKQWKDSVLEHL